MQPTSTTTITYDLLCRIDLALRGLLDMPDETRVHSEVLDILAAQEVLDDPAR